MSRISELLTLAGVPVNESIKPIEPNAMSNFLSLAGVQIMESVKTEVAEETSTEETSTEEVVEEVVEQLNESVAIYDTILTENFSDATWSIGIKLLMEGKKEEFLANQIGEKVYQAYQKDKEKAGHLQNLQNALEVVQFISDHAGAAKPNLDWLVRRYADGQYTLNNIGKVAAAVEAYHDFGAHIPGYEKNLGKNLKVSDVVNSIKEFKGAHVRGEKICRPEEIETIVDEQDPAGHFKAIITHTKNANQFFGDREKEGIQWCTSTPDENHNRFDTYYKPEDPLYVIMAGKRKFQLHMGNSEFMNEKNNPLSKEDIDYLSEFEGYAKLLNYLAKKHYKFDEK